MSLDLNYYDFDEQELRDHDEMLEQFAEEEAEQNEED